LARPVLRNDEGVTALHAERLDLVAEPSSVSAARAFVTKVLDSWGFNGLADTAALLTSELATNVVLHARTRYAVVVAKTVEGARVDVLDDSGISPVLRDHDLSAPTGRGLALVASLAVEWGATPRDDLAGFAKGVRFTVG
jgi:anti-sigma regulatory factor (Ser/Thr protein kinase)